MGLEAVLGVPVAMLQERFRSREARLRVEAPVVVRLDGVRFSRLSGRFEFPRDPRVHEALVHAARVAVRRYGLPAAHVFSDEINLYMLLEQLPYGGRAEKLGSIPASIAAAEASLRLGIPLYFDGRVVSLEHPCEAGDYALFRMRVGLGNYARLLARKIGVEAGRNARLEELLKALAERGVEVSAGWMSTGTFIYWAGQPGGGRMLVETTDPLVFLEALGSMHGCGTRLTYFKPRAPRCTGGGCRHGGEV
jgi:hypothetical protein